MPDLLQQLPEYVLQWLVQKGNELVVPDGDILINNGERCDSLYIVLDGLFVSRGGADTNHQEHIAPGNTIGDISYFTGKPSHTAVLAVEESRVLEIPRHLLQSKLDHDHIYAADLYKAVIATISDKYHHLSLKSPALLHEGDGTQTQNSLLRGIHEEIERFKTLIVRIDKESIKSGGVSEGGATLFMEQARTLMHALHQTLGSDSPIANSEKEKLGARLQSDMLPYLLTTGTAERFYSKPRGYAGDYLAIHAIYENVPSGTGRLGPLIDQMFLEMPPSVAVRNRRKILAEEIVRSAHDAGIQARVMCLASGPASEVFDAFLVLPEKERLKVTLLDIDLQALAFVDNLRAQANLETQIDLVNENLIALFLGRGKAHIPKQDLIYSIGLVDYLNDKLVGKLLQFAFDHLHQGGRIILGNFHPDNPAKEFMDHVLDWKLFHRTEEDMHRLFLASPFRSRCSKITFEECGVDLFAECVRTSPGQPI